VNEQLEIRVIPAPAAARCRAAFAEAKAARDRAQEIANAAVEGMGLNLELEREAGFEIRLVDAPDGSLIALRIRVDAAPPASGAAAERTPAPPAHTEPGQAA